MAQRSRKPMPAPPGTGGTMIADDGPPPPLPSRPAKAMPMPIPEPEDNYNEFNGILTEPQDDYNEFNGCVADQQSFDAPQEDYDEFQGTADDIVNPEGPMDNYDEFQGAEEAEQVIGDFEDTLDNYDDFGGVAEEKTTQPKKEKEKDKEKKNKYKFWKRNNKADDSSKTTKVAPEEKKPAENGIPQEEYSSFDVDDGPQDDYADPDEVARPALPGRPAPDKRRGSLPKPPSTGGPELPNRPAMGIPSKPSADEPTDVYDQFGEDEDAELEMDNYEDVSDMKLPPSTKSPMKSPPKSSVSKQGAPALPNRPTTMATRKKLPEPGVIQQEVYECVDGQGDDGSAGSFTMDTYEDPFSSPSPPALPKSEKPTIKSRSTATSPKSPAGLKSPMQGGAFQLPQVNTQDLKSVQLKKRSSEEVTQKPKVAPQSTKPEFMAVKDRIKMMQGKLEESAVGGPQRKSSDPSSSHRSVSPVQKRAVSPIRSPTQDRSISPARSPVNQPKKTSSISAPPTMAKKNSFDAPPSLPSRPAPDTSSRGSSNSSQDLPPRENKVHSPPAEVNCFVEPEDIYDDACSAAQHPLERFPWYHGEIDRKTGESRLNAVSKNGAFLIRDSAKGGAQQPYTVMVWFEKSIKNLKLRINDNGLYAVGDYKPDELTFKDAEEVITHHKTQDVLLFGNPPGKTKLLFPASKS